MKFAAAVVAATVASASAFAPGPAFKVSTALNMEKGAGGMFDTRNPDAMDHEDPRKSISAAPSFEEYMKMRDGGGAAAAPAPAAPAPAAPAWAPPAAAAPAAPAWTPPAPAAPAAPSHPEMGAGGMFDTRNPETLEHEDPRKSISAAPSFEEYMKQRGGGFTAGAPAPAAPEPVAVAPPAPAAPAWGAPAAAAPAPAAPAWGAPAPAAAEPVASDGPFTYGEYDEQLWDNDAKKDVYAKWDPNSPRSTRNFNPFETFDGNSPDASGIYPGENRYKDPIRPDVNFQQMMEERAEIEERAANPKPGNVPGCPGCKN